MAKVDRKKLLKQPDEFLTFSQRAVEWARENQKTLTIAVTAVVILVLGVLGLRAYLDYRSAKANEAMAAAFPAYTQAVEGGGEAQALTAAEAGLTLVAENYGATPAGIQARLALGSVQLDRGEFAAAEKTLAELAEEPDLPADLTPLVWRQLGQSREGLKSWGGAAEAYRRALEAAGPHLAGRIRLDLARVMEAEGKSDEAARLYREVLAGRPDPEGTGLARARLVALDRDPVSPSPSATN